MADLEGPCSPNTNAATSTTEPSTTDEAPQSNIGPLGGEDSPDLAELEAKWDKERQIRVAATKEIYAKALYKVKNPKPFPKGTLHLVIAENDSGMGRDEGLDDGEGYPVVPIHANIRLKSSMDINCDRPGKTLGNISGWIVQVGRCMNTGVSVHEACDVPFEELFQMSLALLNKDGSFKEREDQQEDDGFFFDERDGDILYIHKLYIKERYRGYGLGLLAIDHLINRLPSFEMDCVVISPSPINPSFLERREGKPKTEVDEKWDKEKYDATCAKLENYYSRLGFERWSKRNASGLSFFGLWTGMSRTPIRKIVPHLFNPYYGERAKMGAGFLSDSEDESMTDTDTDTSEEESAGVDGDGVDEDEEMEGDEEEEDPVTKEKVKQNNKQGEDSNLTKKETVREMNKVNAALSKEKKARKNAWTKTM